MYQYPPLNLVSSMEHPVYHSKSTVPNPKICKGWARIPARKSKLLHVYIYVLNC